MMLTPEVLPVAEYRATCIVSSLVTFLFREATAEL